MRVEVGEDRSLILKDVYNGLVLETREGNQVAICMRDDTFEINVMPKGKMDYHWHRVDMQECKVLPMTKPVPMKKERV